VEVGLLSCFKAATREGHLEQLFRVFAYLKKYNRSSMVFDWTYPELDESVFMECDWNEFYPGASGDKAWAISSDTYVKHAVAKVERELTRVGKELKKKVLTPLASDYRPKLDSTPELDERLASYFASLMGVL
jgi:hypothetical protein